MKDLDKYIHRLKDQKELMSFNEVEEMVMSKAAGSSFKLDLLGFTSILILVAYVGAAFISAESNTDNIVHSKSPIEEHKLVKLEEPQDGELIIDSFTFNPAINFDYNWVFPLEGYPYYHQPYCHVILPDQHQLGYPNGWVDNKVDDSNEISIVDHKLLELFNLYVVDDVMFYSNWKEEGQKEISLYSSGGWSTYISGKMEGNQPILVASPDKIYSKAVSEMNLDTVAWDKLIAVKVPFKCGASPYVVWWFRNTPSLISKLQNAQVKQDFNISYSDVRLDSVLLDKEYEFKINRKFKIDINPNQLVKVDQASLSKLHIISDKNRIEYRKNQRTSFLKKHLLTEVNRGFVRYKKSKKRNTPPSFITSSSSYHDQITEFISSNRYEMNSEQFFAANKHKMLAINVGEVDGFEVVFWYENSKRLLDVISPEEKMKAIKYLQFVDDLSLVKPTMMYANDNVSLIEKRDAFHAYRGSLVAGVELNPEELGGLNIIPSGDGIHWMLDDSSDFQVVYLFGRDFTTLSIHDYEDHHSKSINPVFVSDVYGRMYRLSFSNSKMDDQDLQRLVPIVVRSGKDYRFSNFIDGQYHPDCIFWYEPTDEFLELLPYEIRSQLKSELSYIEEQFSLAPQHTDTSQVQCKYLDPCKISTAVAIDLKVYPNPTADIVNFEANEVFDGAKVTICNLGGEILSNYTYRANEVLKLSLKDLAAGVYLIKAVSVEGEEVTRRVVKE